MVKLKILINNNHFRMPVWVFKTNNKHRKMAQNYNAVFRHVKQLPWE